MNPQPAFLVYFWNNPERRKSASLPDMKKQIKIKKFKNENQERDFWSKAHLADYFDKADFKKASFPNLKPTTRSISLRLPEFIINRAKERANEMNVPYQSLMKRYIAQGLKTEDECLAS